MPPNFSAYPWARVPTLSRRDAHAQSLVARWVGARSAGATRLAALVAPRASRVVAAHVDIHARVADLPTTFDPHAAACTVRVNGLDASVLGPSTAVRTITRRVLGGIDELDAPRPLTVVERSMWSLVVATALEDLGVRGQVWPVLDAARNAATDAIVVAIDVGLADIALTVVVVVPRELELRGPAATARVSVPGWAGQWDIDATIVVGRCALHRDDLARLAPRQLVTLERPTTGTDVELLGGTFGVRAGPGALEATVVRGYGSRDMALPDDAHVELTVAAGTTRMPLRQVLELAVGQIVPLGRPLAGPFEVRAEGRVLGRGELVDVDGELAVRIVSLGD